jgi:hypothetical protein
VAPLGDQGASPAFQPALTSGWFEGRDLAGGRDACMRDSCEGKDTYLSLTSTARTTLWQEKDQWQEEAQERAAEELMMQQDRRRTEAEVWLKEQENFRRCAPAGIDLRTRQSCTAVVLQLGCMLTTCGRSSGHGRTWRRKIAEEEARQEAKRAKYGASWGQAAHGQPRGMGAPRDFLGYFAALGLEEQVESAGCEDIKAAFRRVAMKLHPDRQRKQSEKAREKATAKFLLVQVAYEVSTATNSARGQAHVYLRSFRAHVCLVMIG